MKTKKEDPQGKRALAIVNESSRILREEIEELGDYERCDQQKETR
jgi:hypothetical protein